MEENALGQRVCLAGHLNRIELDVHGSTLSKSKCTKLSSRRGHAGFGIDGTGWWSVCGGAGYGCAGSCSVGLRSVLLTQEIKRIMKQQQWEIVYSSRRERSPALLRINISRHACSVLTMRVEIACSYVPRFLPTRDIGRRGILSILLVHTVPTVVEDRMNVITYSLWILLP